MQIYISYLYEHLQDPQPLLRLVARLECGECGEGGEVEGRAAARVCGRDVAVGVEQRLARGKGCMDTGQG